MTTISAPTRGSVLSPVWVIIALLAALFLRSPMAKTALVYLVFASLLVAVMLWRDANSDRLRGLGPIEWSMIAYVVWNVFSAVAPHRYPPHVSLDRYILIPTVIPFALYVVGRFTVDSERAVKAVLWALTGFAAYSAAVSILQFTGPTQLVWPRYIVAAPNWTDRAVGIFNQPVANGMVLALGFGIAALLARWPGTVWWRRVLASAVAVACGFGLYLTHTRAAWLGGLAVLVIGAALANRARRIFLAALAVVVTVVALNWSQFSSSDRAAGGVASVQEVDDRLNALQTALWAVGEKPLTGWGLGRFSAVNTHHHQQWALDVPWERGYGIVSHQNELGILAELGVIGLTAWLAVLILIARRLWNGYRRLPSDDVCGKSLAVIAIMAMAILVCSALTVDLRFFDFPLAAVFLLFGMAVGWTERWTLQQQQCLSSARYEEELCR
jgi:O-antigen ligase